MRVSLFVSCLVDQLWPSVGTATVDVLRRVGCDVHFDPRQTCCGQPAFNTGYPKEACKVSKHLIEVLAEDDAEVVVVPSGSCAAMIRHLPALFEGDETWQPRATALATRTHELASFLVRVMNVDDVGAKFSGKVTWHDACHGLRELGLYEEPRKLLRAVEGLELVEAESSSTCCGFGGTFSVRYPEISVAMVDAKLEEIEALGVDAVVAGDASCLMQIAGRLAKRGENVRSMHLAEVLAGGQSS